MENNQMPLTFQMALAHNKKAMSAFLNMPAEKQDNIINEAKKQSSLREMNIFVNSIGQNN